MGVLCQIEQRDSGFQITVVCGILTLDVAQAPITLLAPLVNQSMVEARIDLAVSADRVGVAERCGAWPIPPRTIPKISPPIWDDCFSW
ncbi:hypothetical protein ACFO8O_15990 [Hephaestia sp. GCM10023244]|uniref:hypothetical protein n=1 Tax=unclassified Hephaestia TaxID=2631281 RepID=UPI00207713D3|nr:hypothetical protein [Hephaestia sp. MAHUQ-44]MCM8732463.1 hypothetical protein [Hephaestia sp. MAHUQ-44]